MGKIQYIKKARKERKCSKCGNIIKVGITTSDYCKEIGAIVEDWAETFHL